MQNYGHYFGKMWQKLPRRAKDMQKLFDDFVAFLRVTSLNQNGTPSLKRGLVNTPRENRSISQGRNEMKCNFLPCLSENFPFQGYWCGDRHPIVPQYLVNVQIVGQLTKAYKISI